METLVLLCRETKTHRPTTACESTQYSMSLLPFLHRVSDRQDLTCSEALEAMRIILNGAASHVEIAAFLAALRVKGESVEEVVGFSRAMREMAITIRHGLDGET